uniref:Uncharacterized protein n=1 Tax=Ursus americanus TaxID=9643 RepID=A0A452QVT6_URSAM
MGVRSIAVEPTVSMTKEKEVKGNKVAPAPTVVKKQEAKKVVNPLFEKRPKNFGIRQDIQSKRTSPALSDGLATSGCHGRGLFSIHVYKRLLQLTSSPRP